MKKNGQKRHWILCGAALFVLSLSGELRAQDDDTLSDRFDDQMIVQPLTNDALTEFILLIETTYSGLQLDVIDQIPGRLIYLMDVQLPAGWTDADVDLLELDLEINPQYAALVSSAEFLYETENPEGSTGSTFVDGANFSLYTTQYARSAVATDQAHQMSTGREMVIGILDTGVDATHPLLADAMNPRSFDALGGGDAQTDTGDLIDNDSDGVRDEMVGHGTFVAGLIHLAAPDASILSIRVLNSDGTGDGWTLAKGLYYAINAGVEVINISISSTYRSQIIENAVEEAKSLGIVIVGAAGNHDRDTPREYPAMGSSAFGVAAVNDFDVKGEFSNFGDRIFLCAPGVTTVDPGGAPVSGRSIVSTLPGGAYGHWEGTSMATPLVAAAAALIRSQHPEWPPDETTWEAIELILAETSTNIDPQNPGYAGQLGNGRLDLGAAASQGPVTPTSGDLNGDGAVDVVDLLLVLSDWGRVHSSADSNGNGVVDVLDLLNVLVNWS